MEGGPKRIGGWAVPRQGRGADGENGSELDCLKEVGDRRQRGRKQGFPHWRDGIEVGRELGEEA